MLPTRFILFVTVVSVCSGIESQAEDGTIFRLSNSIVPMHYDLWIKTEIDSANFGFMGRVMIILNVTEFTQEIVLHGLQLNIESTELRNSSLNVISVIETSLDNETQLIRIEVEEGLPIDTYELIIYYQGTLRDDFHGFFKSSYENSAGETIWLAATQLEPMDARHVFPCFDEPALKATFSIAIEHACSYNAYSNTRETFTNINGICSTTFEETPVMSTYLVVFLISNFESIENYDGPALPDRLKHRVFGAPNKLQHANFALEAGEKILKDLELYTAINFEINKLDHFAVPGFASIAMENWGGVTYAEEDFYVDDLNDPYTQEERVLILISHELVHQWFGNLVTPEWWEYLWLNEGFAEFFENIIIDRVYEKYDRLNTFAVRTLQPVMQSDAGVTTRAMNYNPKDQNTIGDIFDNVAYDKSGGVLRMMFHAFTADVFQQSVRNYLENNMFQTVNPNDFYVELQKAVTENPLFPDLNVKTIFDSWANQKGFPIINVNYSQETGVISMQQERYIKWDKAEESPKTVWWIPYNFITSSDLHDSIVSSAPDGWLSEETASITPTVERNWRGAQWIVFNKGQTGYYRVNYNPELWAEIMKELKENPDTNIDPIQRAQLIDDALDLALTGRIPYQIPLELLPYLSSNEKTYFGWTSTVNGLSRLSNAIFGSEFYGRFLMFVQKLTESYFTELGMAETPTEAYHINQIRRNLTEWACKSQLNSCLYKTNLILREFLYDDKQISPFLRPTILKNGGRTLTTEDFWKLYGRLSSADSTLRYEILSALAATQNETLRQDFFATILKKDEDFGEDEYKYTESDRVHLLNSIAAIDTGGYDAVIEFLMHNEDRLKELIKSPNNIKAVIKSIAERTVLEIKLVALTQLIKIYTTPDNESDLNEIRIAAEGNGKWFDMYGESIEDWLIANNYEDVNGSASGIFESAKVVVFLIILILRENFLDVSDGL